MTLWSALLYLPAVAAVISAQIPAPHNVTVKCKNFVNILYWNYSQPDLHPRFTVNITSYIKPAQIVPWCSNTSDLHCDLSSLTNDGDNYIASVGAAVGQSMSRFEDTKEFSYNRHLVDEQICTFDFPPTNVSQVHEGLLVQFMTPFHFYKRQLHGLRSLQGGKQKKIFHYTTMNKTSRYTCPATSNMCETTIFTLEPETRCVELEGVLGDMKFIMPEKACVDFIQVGVKGKAETQVPILVAVCSIVVIAVVVVVGGLIYKNKTSVSNLPKTGVFAMLHRSRENLEPEYTPVSKVEASPLRSPSLEEEKTQMTQLSEDRTEERLHFRIGLGKAESTESDDSGNNLGAEDEDSGPNLSGYNQPKLLKELFPGDTVMGYKG